jgi:hypothetical protein
MESGFTGGVDAAPTVETPSSRYRSPGPSPGDRLDRLCFEVGDALVQEPVVGARRRRARRSGTCSGCSSYP